MTPIPVHLLACAVCGTTDADRTTSACPSCATMRRVVATIDGTLLAAPRTTIHVTPCPKESVDRELFAVAPDGTHTLLFQGLKAVAVQLCALIPRIRELVTEAAN